MPNYGILAGPRDLVKFINPLWYMKDLAGRAGLALTRMVLHGVERQIAINYQQTQLKKCGPGCFSVAKVKIHWDKYKYYSREHSLLNNRISEWEKREEYVIDPLERVDVVTYSQRTNAKTKLTHHLNRFEHYLTELNSRYLEIESDENLIEEKNETISLFYLFLVNKDVGTSCWLDLRLVGADKNDPDCLERLSEYDETSYILKNCPDIIKDLNLLRLLVNLKNDITPKVGTTQEINIDVRLNRYLKKKITKMLNDISSKYPSLKLELKQLDEDYVSDTTIGRSNVSDKSLRQGLEDAKRLDSDLERVEDVEETIDPSRKVSKSESSEELPDDLTETTHKGKTLYRSQKLKDLDKTYKFYNLQKAILALQEAKEEERQRKETERRQKKERKDTKDRQRVPPVEEVLPPGWEKKIARSGKYVGRSYYVNVSDRTRQWEIPTHGGSSNKTEKQSSKINNNRKTMKSTKKQTKKSRSYKRRTIKKY